MSARVRRIRRLALGGLAAALVLPFPARAQVVSGSAAVALEVAEEARRIHETGAAAQARSILRDALGGCEPGETGRYCRQVLRFNRAYLAQSVAADAPDRDARLKEAADDYLAVLGDAPGHLPTLNNLASVYARLGPGEVSPEMLRGAAAADPGRAAGYLVLLGDHHRLAGESAAARDAYLEALRRSVDDAGPLYRLVSLYREEAPHDAAGLRAVLEGFEDRFPDAAAEGYAAIIAAVHARSAGEAEHALLKWAELSARGGGLDATALARLPAAWRPPAVLELERYLADPWTPPARPSWWLADDARSEVLAGVALALGERMMLDGRPQAAESCWRGAADFAPRHGGNALELARELASLYYRNPALDASGAKLRELEERLYEGKGAAIESQDLAAMQRFHSVLGLLYAERGVWRSDLPWTNGIFQLERALEAAARRESSERLFQPLPVLKALLADGYAALGRQEEARQTWVLAARAHLDSDDVAAAGALLERAAAGGGTAAVQTRGIFELRSRLASRRAAADSRELCSSRGIERAFAGRDPALERVRRLESDPQAFLNRQRFKVLADCATRVEGALARGYAASALELAAEPAEGPADADPADIRDTAARRALRYGGAGRAPAVLLSPGDALRVEEVTRLAAVRDGG